MIHNGTKILLGKIGVRQSMLNPRFIFLICQKIYCKLCSFLGQIFIEKWLTKNDGKLQKGSYIFNALWRLWNQTIDILRVFQNRDLDNVFAHFPKNRGKISLDAFVNKHISYPSAGLSSQLLLPF